MSKESITVEYVGSTDKGLWVTEDGGKTKHFLPFSQIEFDSPDGHTPRTDKNGNFEVEVPAWLLSQKGFAGY